MVRIRRSRHVRPDLLRIARWIARDNPFAAERVLRRIDRAFRFIKEPPRAGSPREDLGVGLRMAVAGNYLVIYRVEDRGPIALRVVHGAMDLSEIDLD